MNEFDKMHAQWLQAHLDRRTGERKRRLEQGHRHAEKEMLCHIWWPAFGSLEYLHPEYEVIDYYGGTRFIDLAYIRKPFRVGMEVDGFGPHVRTLSRRQFCDQWVRQMHLTLDGWTVVRIGYDDIAERPRWWQQLLQQMIGAALGTVQHPVEERERAVMRLALRLNRPVRMADIRGELDCSYRTARKMIADMEQKQMLQRSGGGTMRIHEWTLNTEFKNMKLL